MQDDEDQGDCHSFKCSQRRASCIGGSIEPTSAGGKDRAGRFYRESEGISYKLRKDCRFRQSFIEYLLLKSYQYLIQLQLPETGQPYIW